MKLVLASSSTYRASLLKRLQIPFTVLAPEVDESAHAGEAPERLAGRLATAKARALYARHPKTPIIGSDQVACVNGQILGKPGNFERACEQLSLCSGELVHFYTGLCLIDSEGDERATVVDTQVQFRQLGQAEIERYLRLDEPYDCAGSFKCESLGISLFESLRSDDPTALEGLPLIALTQMLRAVGLDPLQRS